MDIFNITSTISIEHLQYLFDGDEKLLKSLKIDNISIYSITPHKQAESINKILLEYISEDAVITDMTACIGGNTILFCKAFKYVNAIEICKERYDFLEHNLAMYNLKNYKAYNVDCMKIIDNLQQDLIFIDAPWNGKSYKYKPIVNLFLSGKHIYNIVNSLKGKSKYIVLKVPNKF